MPTEVLTKVANAGRVPFRKLPLRKRRFVEHYIKTNDASLAFEKAGYKAKNSKAGSVKLLRELQPYISEQVTEYLKGSEMAIFGLKTLRDLAENSKNDMVKLNAAKELLSRNIPEEPKETHVHHHSASEPMSNEELKERIRKLSNDMFLEAKPVDPSDDN